MSTQRRTQTKARPVNYLLDKLGDRCCYNSKNAAAERELAVKAASGDHDARRILIESMAALAYRVASSFSWTGVDIDDLFSAAMLGATEGVDRFDVKRGTRLTTAVYDNIHKRVFELASEGTGQIHIPRHARPSSKITYVSLADIHCEPHLREIEKKDAEIDALRVLEVLAERHRFILKRHFGIGCAETTLEAITQEMGRHRASMSAAKFTAFDVIRNEFPKEIEAKCG